MNKKNSDSIEDCGKFALFLSWSPVEKDGCIVQNDGCTRESVFIYI